MNNFDTSEKIAGIDAAIESVLNEYNIDWKDKRLYSWGYTAGLEPLDFMRVYAKGGMTIKDVNNKKVSDHISSKFINVRNGMLAKPNFIMELSTVLYKNTSPYNIVVSDIEPNAELFDGQTLHSEVGKWYTGLE